MAALPAAPVTVRITRLPGGRGLPLPTRATAGSAGFDLHAALEDELVLEPGDRALVPTGFAIAVPSVTMRRCDRAAGWPAPRFVGADAPDDRRGLPRELSVIVMTQGGA